METNVRPIQQRKLQKRQFKTLQLLSKHSLGNICPPERKHVGKRIKKNFLRTAAESAADGNLFEPLTVNLHNPPSNLEQIY